MDHRSLVVAALVACTGIAHAGYAQLSPPPGFGSVAGGFGYSTAANDAVAGRIVTQASGLTANVGGQAVRMGVAYRFAANAPIYAARAIFLNPYVAAGVGIAAWLAASKLSWDPVTRTWSSPDASVPVSDGYEYRSLTEKWFASAAEACSQTYANMTAEIRGNIALCIASDGRPLFEIGRRPSSCPAGWFLTPAGCLQTVPGAPLSQDDFVRKLNPDNHPGWPMPDSVPKELPPGTLLPVEQPVVNPSPGANPASQPMFVPSGNPVPNPNYNPSAPVSPANQPYVQPGVRVVPTPTPTSPWQVDLQPVNRPVGSADPSPGPQTDGAAQPNPDDKPSDEKPDFCEKNPEVVACQKLGDVQPEALEKKTVTLQINREDGFGPSQGQCPAPREFVVLGKAMAFRWDLLCDFASSIRPLLIGFAYLSAALAFMGLSRKET